MTTPIRSKVFLIVLDGFGIGKDYPFNAIQNSKMPFYKNLQKRYPCCQLQTCGHSVGLPDGTMGNSEVGHMNIAAGRIVYQELSRIQRDITSGTFFTNTVLRGAVSHAQTNRSCLHLMGLMSDAGVHSHLDHLEALIKMVAGSTEIALHLFTDGRDTPPTSSLKYLERLRVILTNNTNCQIRSIAGRYYGMDRDQRWERTEKAYHAITGTTDNILRNANIDAVIDYIKQSHERGVTDEFIEPTHVSRKQEPTAIQADDVMVFFNFRADRARQITDCLSLESFDKFKRKSTFNINNYICMTEYFKQRPYKVAYPPQNLTNILPSVLEQNGLRQFRIAETEKYAHVTFFFNGGREALFTNENRSLIESPKDVATYDLKPEMSAFAVAETLRQTLETGTQDFVLANFANPDMVGHTGNYAAAVQALQAVDRCLETTISAAIKQNYTVMITADHGNAEEMVDCNGEPHTQHTLNPVPFHLIGNGFEKIKLHDGVLANISPTILKVMGLPIPQDMTAQPLF